MNNIYNIIIIAIFHTVHMWSVLNRIKRDVYSVRTLYCIHSKRSSRSFTTPPLSQRALASEPAHALNTLLAQKNRIPSEQREEITC